MENPNAFGDAPQEVAKEPTGVKQVPVSQEVPKKVVHEAPKTVQFPVKTAVPTTVPVKAVTTSPVKTAVPVKTATPTTVPVKTGPSTVAPVKVTSPVKTTPVVVKEEPPKEVVVTPTPSIQEVTVTTPATQEIIKEDTSSTIESIKSDILGEAETLLSGYVGSTMYVTILWSTFTTVSSVETLRDNTFATLLKVFEDLCAQDIVKLAISDKLKNIEIHNRIQVDSQVEVVDSNLVYYGSFDKSADSLPTEDMLKSVLLTLVPSQVETVVPVEEVKVETIQEENKEDSTDKPSTQVETTVEIDTPVEEAKVETEQVNTKVEPSQEDVSTENTTTQHEESNVEVSQVEETKVEPQADKQETTPVEPQVESKAEITEPTSTSTEEANIQVETQVDDSTTREELITSINNDIIPEAQNILSDILGNAVTLTIQWDTFHKLNSIETLRDEAFSVLLKAFEDKKVDINAIDIQNIPGIYK
jgi:hypothetical protein